MRVYYCKFPTLLQRGKEHNASPLIMYEYSRVPRYATRARTDAQTDTPQVHQPPTGEQGRRALDLILSGGYNTAGGAKKKEVVSAAYTLYEHPQIAT